MPLSSDLRQRLGERGERLAAEHLVRRGYRILERNYRTRWGELDIVAFDGCTLAFCEVKTRRAGAGDGREQAVVVGPFEAIHPSKRRRVRNMAQSWLSERTDRPYASMLRFDAIAVTLDRRGELISIEHLESAF